ncbi:MAG: GH3 auxin-responsive promoter family protein [Gemmataceae bacterium]
MLEALLAARCRRHLAWLDRIPAGRSQLRALLGLAYRARATSFGRDHDFRRVRSAADFRRLVPTRSAAELARFYGEDGKAWPKRDDPVVTGETGRPVRLSPELIRAHRRAIRTALAVALRARSRTRLLDGSLLWLGDGSRVLHSGRYTPRELVQARFPLTVHHAVLDAADGHVEELARRYARESLTCLVGPAARLAAFVEQARRVRGEERLSRLWPRLGIVVCLSHAPIGPSSWLPADDRVKVVELVTRPEAPLAVSDDRHGGLRLLVEHGSYFEFVAPGRAGAPHPPRLGLDEVEVGVPYEVALTSPAGLWAQRTGLSVRFDQLDPPLLTVVGSVRADEPAAPAPRRYSDGSPAVPPGTPGHSPWSAPADRG